MGSWGRSAARRPSSSSPNCRPACRPDSERSHRNFCAKHELNFTLLADTDHSVCEAFGVWAEKSMYGRKYMGVLRTTFVIDAEGRIEKIFTKVDTKNHYRQIIDSYK